MVEKLYNSHSFMFPILRYSKGIVYPEYEFNYDLSKKYAKEYAVEDKIENIKNLMKNMHLSLEQVLDSMEIDGKERACIISKFKN